MKIQSIHFDDNEMPRLVTAKLTIREAAMITKAFGRLSPTSASEQGLDHEVTRAVYDSLTSVFNAYYEDGLNDFLRAEASRG
ncbi:hypothetical protein [Nonomuraea sp. bgisy101]|uniref:hypothetical protein n=1 Tax=Nonomuraea sp. bgisy101 TaxID=3413784 RepID=UPI003D72D7B3